jgi:hypothetical protein
MTAPADSDSDFPPRVAIPWWRHRRRLFYLVTGLLAIALPWGGWHWWYRADFPLPHKQLARTHPQASLWLYLHQLDLVMWKYHREIRHLELEMERRKTERDRRETETERKETSWKGKLRKIGGARD